MLMPDNRQTSVEAIRDAITADGHSMFFRAEVGLSGNWECRSRQQHRGQSATVFCICLTDEAWHLGTYSYRSFILPTHVDIVAACITLLNSENDDVANIPDVVARSLGLRETEKWLSIAERYPSLHSH
jgi:hypothetical protein